ncbi:LysR family transcriptional regulator [Streptomyces sp. NPDC088354]|uniref:LysR family transcriptional regulator n=1 Tax=unclassified Streptomyces TaxID=2593676 RepID=UPI0029AF0F76|nr:LysR family transcriptional regulator [Streptomyces sp. MI02-7b]MDX3075752.1 LysR family transcriptional regulator [Streptomyces sp. MI02-7b]
MTPDLRQLRYFVAVAEESNFTRAAARVRISQQSLSQQITLMERMIGAKLFERGARGTRLTGVGELFLPEARAVLERADEAVEVVARALRGDIGSLRLAFLATTTNHLLPTVMRAVRRHLPTVTVSTDETSIARLVQGLTGGQYDVAFTRPPLVDGLASRTLVTEPVCAVLPEDHPLAGRAELALRDLAGDHWVMTPPSSWAPWHRAFDEHFRAAGFTPDVVQTAVSAQGLLGLVAAGVGVTRLPRSARSLRRTGVVFVPLTGEFAPTVMVWRPDDTSPALHRLLDVVSDAAQAADLTEAG